MTPIRPNADTPIRFCPHRQLTLATVLSLCFILLVPGAGAAQTEFASQPTTFLELEVAVRAHPRKAAATVIEFLQSGPSGSIKFVGQSVTATMRGLGPIAGRAAVGRVIMAVVKARPLAVLEIVRVAIPLARKDLHPEIVASAVAGIVAVADVYMPISVIVADDGSVGYEPFNSRNGGGPVQVVAGMSFVQGATLAEDIVQVAFQSGSHESMAALSQSANGVLNQGTSDPLATLGQLPNRPLGFGFTQPLATPAPVSP
jgi:hypothetical protein